MTVKRISALLLATVLSVCTVTGCARQQAMPSENANNKGISIVTTTFPEYDWVRAISEGTDASITILEDSGADLHNYQPTAEDIVKIKSSDLFIYVGGESDEWAEKLIEEDPSINALNLLETLGDNAKIEEEIEGAEAEEEEEEEYDEHIWLSLENAKICCSNITSRLEGIDQKNAGIYQDNLREYIDRINDLNSRYTEVTDNAKQKVLLFGDRFPFRYMADDYGLKCYAAFSGCSAETEASFETITFLAEKVDENALDHVVMLENSDGKIADTIIKNAKKKDVTIVVMDSMQNITKGDIEAGTTYLEIMESNCEALKKALN